MDCNGVVVNCVYPLFSSSSKLLEAELFIQTFCLQTPQRFYVSLPVGMLKELSWLRC